MTVRLNRLSASRRSGSSNYSTWSRVTEEMFGGYTETNKGPSMSEVSKNLNETSGACVKTQVRSKCGSPSDFVRDVTDNYLGRTFRRSSCKF